MSEGAHDEDNSSNTLSLSLSLYIIIIHPLPGGVYTWDGVKARKVKERKRVRVRKTNKRQDLEN